MGAVVTAISRSEAKKDLAMKCGADNFIATSNAEAVADATGSLDLILDTVPAHHDLTPYLPLLDADGKHVLLGITQTWAAAAIADKMFNSVVVPSLIGGIQNTQEVIDLCAKANPPILPEIELKPVEELNAIYTALDASNDSGVRYVLDLQGTLNETAFDKCTAPPPTLKAPEKPISLKSVVGELFGLTKLRICGPQRAKGGA